MKPHLKLIPLVLLVSLFGCASYQSRPLPERPDFVTDLQRLSIDKTDLRLPGIQAQVFDPSDGLDEIEVAVLAVSNNPLLKAERAKVGIGRAQLFAAGLLPDPELSLELEHPTNGGPDLINAFGLALSYPVQSLVARGAARDAATARAHQLDLELMWQEWQVAQQARMLYVRQSQQDARLKLLQEYQQRLEERYASSQRLAQAGNLTLANAATDLVALLTINTRLDNLEQHINRTRDALVGLLGLDPTIKLVLAVHNPPVTRTDMDIDTVLAVLPDRRPDLLALKLGYESQDAKLRKAILEQFPAISIGLSRGRDTDDVHTVGIGVTLRLPFLSGNRGAIAVEKATREHLWDVYQARLAEAYLEVHQLSNEIRLLERQLEQVHKKLPELEQMVIGARNALDQGNLDSYTYLNMEMGLLEKRVEAIQLEANLQEVRIGLQTFAGLPVNDVTDQVP